jgi:hypothetical protein
MPRLVGALRRSQIKYPQFGSWLDLDGSGPMSGKRRRNPLKLGDTSARGYGTAHQRERAKWVPIVNASDAVCTRCGRPIMAGTAWDLDHTDDRRGYLGPAHRACNRGRRQRGLAELEQPTRFSRVW